MPSTTHKHGYSRFRSQGILAALLCGTVLLVTLAPSKADQPQRLEQLRQEISQLQQALDKNLETRDQQQAELRSWERRIGKLRRDMRATTQQSKQQTSKLKRLGEEQRSTRSALSQQTDLLRDQLVAAYSMGQQGYLKLVLNQQQPSSIRRNLVYYRYITRARQAQLDATHSKLAKLGQLHSSINTNQRELQRLAKTQGQQQQSMQTAIDRRARVLKKLEQRISDQSGNIARLRENELRLQGLVQDLQDRTTRVPAPAVAGLKFPQARGKLPLPIRGTLLARYGTPKNQGDLRWKGVFFAAPEGRKVGAVHAGRVIYADWLRGFGLLLILEHGDGYMTLYGHNLSLYKEVGDWVEARQTIAISGSSGNPPQAGVYFEIRHDGKPYDPLVWLAARFG